MSFALLQKCVAYLLSGIGLVALSFGGELSFTASAAIAMSGASRTIRTRLPTISIIRFMTSERRSSSEERERSRKPAEISFIRALAATAPLSAPRNSMEPGDAVVSRLICVAIMSHFPHFET